MRKTLILTLVLCVFAVIAYAQTGAAPATSGTSTSAAPATTGTGAAAAAPAKHGKSHTAKCTYKGTVTVVGDNTFTVKPAKGDDVVLKVNDKTTYWPKGKTWADVKVDAKVSGSCKKDGADTWATTVKFAAEKKMKAKAEPAAAPKTGK